MVVHRLLAAAIGLERLPDQARDRDALRALCDNLNARHRNAQMAGRASVELHTLIFFRERQVVADARITKVSAHKRNRPLTQGQSCHSYTLAMWAAALWDARVKTGVPLLLDTVILGCCSRQFHSQHPNSLDGAQKRTGAYIGLLPDLQPSEILAKTPLWHLAYASCRRRGPG